MPNPTKGASKPKLLNPSFKVLDYSGEYEEKKLSVDNVLDLKNPRPHCSKDGDNFALSLKYRGPAGKFSLTNFHIRGGIDCSAPVRTGLLWVSEKEVKVDTMLKYKSFTAKDFKDLTGDSTDPVLFFKTDDDTFSFNQEFKSNWLEGKFVGVLFISSDGDNIDVQDLILFGFDNTTENHYKVGPIPKKLIPSVEWVKENRLKWEIKDLDTDGDGFISTEELKPILEELEVPEDIRESISETILGDEGKAPIDEVVKFYKKILETDDDDEILNNVLYVLFKKFDRDGDGILSNEEFKEMLVFQGLLDLEDDSELNEQDQLKVLLATFDENGDGKVTVEEVVSFIKNAENIPEDEMLSRMAKGTLRVLDRDNDGLLSFNDLKDDFIEIYTDMNPDLPRVTKENIKDIFTFMGEDGKMKVETVIDLLCSGMQDALAKIKLKKPKKKNSDKYVVLDVQLEPSWNSFLVNVRIPTSLYNNDILKLYKLLEEKSTVAKKTKTNLGVVEITLETDTLEFEPSIIFSDLLNAMDEIGFDLVTSSHDEKSLFTFKRQKDKKDEDEVEFDEDFFEEKDEYDGYDSDFY